MTIGRYYPDVSIGDDYRVYHFGIDPAPVMPAAGQEFGKIGKIKEPDWCVVSNKGIIFSFANNVSPGSNASSATVLCPHGAPVHPMADFESLDAYDAILATMAYAAVETSIQAINAVGTKPSEVIKWLDDNSPSTVLGSIDFNNNGFLSSPVISFFADGSDEISEDSFPIDFNPAAADTTGCKKKTCEQETTCDEKNNCKTKTVCTYEC